MSPMQQGMLFHSLYEQEGVDYINQLRVDVDDLDSDRFEAAWQATLAAHESLRSAFLWQGVFEQPVQVITRQVQVPLELLDWQGRDDLATALDAAAEAQRNSGFVLDRAPLLRLCLIRTAQARHHLIFTNHHILLDGWSNAQLFGEVLQRYAGLPWLSRRGVTVTTSPGSRRAITPPANNSGRRNWPHWTRRPGWPTACREGWPA